MALVMRSGRRATTPTWSGGASGGGGAEPVGGGPGGPPASGGSGSGWVNVQNYLDANRPQAAALGQDMAGKLDKEAQGASRQADTYRQQMNDYMTKSQQVQNPDRAAWDSMTPEQQQAMQQFMGPFAQTMGKTQGTMAWNLPKTVAGGSLPQPVMPTKPGEVLGKINAAQTPGGLAAMFAERAGPQYTAGQGNLDSYFAQAGGGGQAIRDLGTKYGKVLDLLKYPYPGVDTSGANRPPGPPGTTEPGQHPVSNGGAPSIDGWTAGNWNNAGRPARRRPAGV